MRYSAKIVLLASLLTITGLAEAKTLNIGGTSMVPPAAGFTICGDELGEFIKLMSAGVPGTNRVLAVIEDADHQKLAAGDRP